MHHKNALQKYEKKEYKSSNIWLRNACGQVKKCMREKAKEMPDGVITLQHQAIFTMIFQEYLVLIFQFEEMNMVVHSQEFTIFNV